MLLHQQEHFLVEHCIVKSLFKINIYIFDFFGGQKYEIIRMHPTLNKTGINFNSDGMLLLCCSAILSDILLMTHDLSRRVAVGFSY